MGKCEAIKHTAETSGALGVVSMDVLRKMPLIKLVFEFVFFGKIEIEPDGSVYLNSINQVKGDISHGRYLSQREIDDALVWGLTA